MMQSLIPAIYPILKQNFQLDFAQIGLITFVLQLTGALLQPVIVLRRGQGSIAWFSVAALVAMAFLVRVGSWYKGSGAMHAARRGVTSSHNAVSSRQVTIAIAILLALLFSKFIYLSSLGSYYTFYLISRFGLSVQSAQVHLFVFLGAVAAGTIV